MPETLPPVFRIARTMLEPTEWSRRIEINEIHAVIERERVVRFAELLDEEPLIDRAIHERLDLVLALAPAIDVLRLEDIAERAWASAGG